MTRKQEIVFEVIQDLMLAFVINSAATILNGGFTDTWVYLVGMFEAFSINYVAGYFLGRPIIYKFANSHIGHLCLLNQEKVEKSEKYFYDHGVAATLTGRLIPGIRHLISIPAGLSKMPYWKFLLYTTIGAGVWHSILAGLGWYLHSFVPEDQLTEKLIEYGDYIKWGIIAIVLLAIAYFVIKRMRKRKTNRS